MNTHNILLKVWVWRLSQCRKVNSVPLSFHVKLCRPSCHIQRYWNNHYCSLLCYVYEDNRDKNVFIRSHVQGRIWGGGFPGFRNPPPPPPLPYACTFSKRNKTKKQPLDPARGPMRLPGPPAETPPMIDLVRPWRVLFLTIKTIA